MDKKTERIDDNSLYISGKPFMKYVTGAVVQFTRKDAKEIVIKARGKFISRAVDVAEFVRNKFLKDLNLKLKSVRIGSEEFETKEKRKIGVSTIEITISK